ncbi:MAG: hypothetical protein RLZZ381_1107 [Cyanobacteriota bacterium]|jgi:hypothetical protein
MKSCFIACPIGSEDSQERQRSDKLFVGNIVLELRDEKKAEREDRNNQMAMQLFGNILNQGIQNPDGLRALIELAESQKTENDSVKAD